MIITSKSMEEYIFEFVFVYAMRDAVMRGAFAGEKKWLENVYDAKNIVKQYIDKILSGTFTSKESHDNDFLETAKKVCNCINNSPNKPKGCKGTFTFGNAQKLINMTVKRFYLVYYIDKSYRDKFRFCHCPMDDILLKWVWENYCSEENVPKIERNAALGRRNEFLDSWGKEGFSTSPTKLPDRYKKFQATIKKWGDNRFYIPIEMDYCVW